ncbi:hypothetical protein HDV05_005220 [Chytridiales sp. JEL 0842]|nr:hypothetical protein HDV05_005220 [Chytridiales sp. JEL 0842]
MPTRSQSKISLAKGALKRLQSNRKASKKSDIAQKGRGRLYIEEENNLLLTLSEQIRPPITQSDIHRLTADYNANRPHGSPARTARGLEGKLRKILPKSSTFKVNADTYNDKLEPPSTDRYWTRNGVKHYSPEENTVFLKLLQEWKSVTDSNADEFAAAYNARRPNGSPLRTAKALRHKATRQAKDQLQTNARTQGQTSQSSSFLQVSKTLSSESAKDNLIHSDITENSPLTTSDQSLLANLTRLVGDVSVQSTTQSQQVVQYQQSTGSAGGIVVVTSNQPSAQTQRSFPAPDHASNSTLATLSSDIALILRSITRMEHNFSFLEERVSNLERQKVVGERQKSQEIEMVREKIMESVGDLEKAGRVVLEQMDLLKAMQNGH